VQVIGASSWYGKLRHTTSLAPEIDALLKRTNHKIDDLSALGVAIGPGSFTSLRVGLSLMKGLALARSLPLIGVPTLDILSATVATRDIRLACLLQAGRGRLAVGYYNASDTGGWESEDNLSVMRIDELVESIEEPTLICGELSAEEREIIAKVELAELCSPARSLRNPASLAEIAWERYQAKNTRAEPSRSADDAASLSPIYLQVGAQIPS